jgi:small nuclear ribonucleoprotein (snRNP)-like protein
MTNKKISEFTELTAPASTDVLPIIDVSGGGTGSNNKITYANLLGKAPDGSASAPAFSFNSDTNSGISGGSDTLTFSTAGVGRMTISSAGLVNIPGDLTVGGTTTTINTTNLDVEDKNITLGKVTTPSDTTADGGGLTLKGATDKTFNWVNATDSWTSSEHISVSGQKEFRYLDSDSSHYVGFKSPATVSSNVVWTLPSADSSVSGYVLSSNASGVLSWVAPGQNADPNFTGTLTLTDDGNIRGFASTHATYTGSVKTFTVTVASKTAAHRYNGSGSGNGYKIDGKEAPFLTLTPGRTYKFDQSDGTKSGHPLRFYLEANKTTAYTTNVTTSGTPGSSGAYTQIVIADTTPMVIHYQCSSHALMGNGVATNSATATGTLLSSLSVSGNMDVTGTFTVSDNILMTGTGAIDVASGTTAQRPGSPSGGMFRFNSQTSEFEGYNGSSWGEIGGVAATGTADLLDIASSSGTGGGSATFNGSAYRFKLVTKGTSTAVTPSNAEILRVSINGVMQQPNDGSGQGDMTDGYVVSGTDIIFDAAPPSGATYFIINMGATIAIGTPGDNTVTSAKIVDGTIVGTDLATNVDLADNQKVRFGAGNDLQIYHNGNNSFIVDSGTGDLYIRGDNNLFIQSGSGESKIKATTDGAVELYHNDVKKFETTSAGATVTGTLTATAYAGDGSGLTGVSSQVADGCITENSLTISNNYTMTTNKSGVSAGDIIIASGVTVTIPSGSRYVIV